LSCSVLNFTDTFPQVSFEVSGLNNSLVYF
jgi:hypothetical protein